MHMTHPAEQPQDGREWHAARFREAVAGVPAHHVTQALNLLTPGIDWRRSTKRSMALHYGDAQVNARRATFPRLASISLIQLSAMSRARWGGLSNWREIDR